MRLCAPCSMRFALCLPRGMDLHFLFHRGSLRFAYVSEHAG